MSINNNDDVIDSRDVIARIEELEREAIAAYERDGGEGDELPVDFDAYAYLDDSDVDELRSLRELAEQGESLSDWQHGETLIRDSYFEDYARELAEDIGAVDRNASWPNTYIDWEAAAEALQTDYTDVEFDGVTYWGR